MHVVAGAKAPAGVIVLAGDGRRAVLHGVALVGVLACVDSACRAVEAVEPQERAVEQPRIRGRRGVPPLDHRRRRCGWVGAVNRVPSEGEARSNLHVGGTATMAELSDRDREICAVIGPELRRRGLLFVGIDVIGDYLTEINVTSPTGIREIQRLSGINIAGLTWDAIEKRRPTHASNGIAR